jgi:hypothetical protein
MYEAIVTGCGEAHGVSEGVEATEGVEAIVSGRSEATEGVEGIVSGRCEAIEGCEPCSNCDSAL